jgi:nitrite reductase/ring-hydroxylating ferredoxin subunit
MSVGVPQGTSGLYARADDVRSSRTRPVGRCGADLGDGSVDADGCLVCPWHQSRDDVRTGEMVEGPRGFLGYHGRTPVYTQLVAAFGKLARLRVRRAAREGTDVVLE